MGSNRRGRETRERILGAASACFGRDGFDMTVEQVAEEAGVTRVTVHRHFATRDDLLTNLLIRDAASVASRMRDALERDRPWTERLADAIVVTVEEVRSSPSLWAAVTAANPGTAWARVDPAGRFQDAVRGFLLPYMEQASAEVDLRVSSDEAMDWIMRQVLLMLAVPGAHGSEPAAIRWEVETFVLPALVRGA